jgi:hypothetical protein
MGVQERVVTSMGPAGAEDEQYDELVSVLSPILIGQLETWAARCATEMRAEIDAAPDVDAKVDIVRDYIRRKLIASSHLSEAEADPDILVDYLTRIRDLFVANLFGGKKRFTNKLKNRANPKTRVKKITPHSKKSKNHLKKYKTCTKKYKKR